MISSSSSSSSSSSIFILISIIITIIVAVVVIIIIIIIIIILILILILILYYSYNSLLHRRKTGQGYNHQRWPFPIRVPLSIHGDGFCCSAEGGPDLHHGCRCRCVRYECSLHGG